jgi:hypothetical protein
MGSKSISIGAVLLGSLLSMTSHALPMAQLEQ